jgi:DNA repair protein RadC
MMHGIPRYTCQLVMEGESPYHGVDRLSSPSAVAAFMAPQISGRTEEELWAIYFDVKLQPIGMAMLSRGSVTQSVFSAMVMLRFALLLNSMRIVLVHNHPSGKPEPTEDDIRVTRRAAEACQLMQMKLLDHVIIGHDGAYKAISEIISW